MEYNESKTEITITIGLDAIVCLIFVILVLIVLFLI